MVVLILTLLSVSLNASVLEQKLLPSFEMSSPRENKLVINKTLNEPPGTWVNIFRIDQYCFWYKTPFGKKSGEILLKKDFNQSCEDFSKEGEVYYQKGIRKFKYVDVPKDTYLGNLYLKKYYYLDFEIENKKEIIKFLKLGKNKNFYLAEKKVSLKKIESGNYCYKVSSTCKVEMENECDRCQKGFLEVLDTHCEKGSSRKCGATFCGERGLPACHTGWKKYYKKFQTFACDHKEDLGFCQRGLRKICDENGVLICL